MSLWFPSPKWLTTLVSSSLPAHIRFRLKSGTYLTYCGISLYLMLAVNITYTNNVAWYSVSHLNNNSKITILVEWEIVSMWSDMEGCTLVNNPWIIITSQINIIFFSNEEQLIVIWWGSNDILLFCFVFNLDWFGFSAFWSLLKFQQLDFLWSGLT